MLLENIQNKVRNAQKRFRQGRITYKKLQSIVQACRQEAFVSVSKEVAEQKQAHVHGEHCDHSHEDAVILDADHNALVEETLSDIVDPPAGSIEDAAFVGHVHGEHCNH